MSADIGTVAVGQTQTTVAITGILHDGTELTKDIMIPHKAGLPDANILAGGYNILQQMGGLLMDTEGGLDFYPASQFKGPFKLRLKHIIVTNATGASLKAGAIQLR